MYSLNVHQYHIQEAQTAFRQGMNKLQDIATTKKRRDAISLELGALDVDNGDLQVMRDCLLTIADDEQNKIVTFIETICSDGLSYVFDLPLQVKFERRVSAGFTIIEIEVTQGNGAGRDPLAANGGGLVEVLSLLLRVCFVYFYKDMTRPILLLDEPCAKLDATRIPKLAQLLRDLSDRLSLQVILITHHPAFTQVATHNFYVDQGTVSEITLESDELYDTER